jgi:virulence-associated protein VapD
MTSNKDTSKKFWFIGRVHPRTDGGYKKAYEFSERDDFTNEEVKNMKLVDIPICLNHDDRFQIGKVVSDFQDETGAKYICAYVDITKALGRCAMKIVKGGLDTQLSIKHAASTYATLNGTTRIEKTPLEVSILEEARFKVTDPQDACKIIYAFTDSEMMNSIPCEYCFH